MPPEPQNRRIPPYILLGILLLAMTLRAPFTGTAPLLGTLGAHFQLSTAQIGMLTTLPLLAFAIISPCVPSLSRRLGFDKSLIMALLLMCLGIVLRSSGQVVGLFIGTSLIGAGIAVGNIILPSLLKRDFSSALAKLTGAYSLTMGVAAALASLLVVPIASAYGWQVALGTLILFPLIALCAWLPRLKQSQDVTLSTAAAFNHRAIWRSSLAWQITLFLGLNSLIYYIMVGWLPALLISNGYSLSQAGSLHGVLQLATAIPGLIIGLVIARCQDQRWIAASMASLWMISLLGLWIAPNLAIIWISLGGFGSGASMILGLTLIGLRTVSAHQAVALSGMAQSVGYLLAAAGPPIMGKIHDLSGSWHMPLLCCLVLASVMVMMGFLAGRRRQVSC